MKSLFALIAMGSVVLGACTANVDARGAGAQGTPPEAPKTKADKAGLRTKGGDTPPADSKPAGKQSKPSVQGVVIPIVDVEVYTFDDDWNGDGSLDTVYWSHVDGGSTFLWANGTVQCSDGLSDASAAFVMEVKADGSGSYMYAADGCGWSNFYGCDLDAAGNETTCGSCAMDTSAIVCAAVSK